MISALAKLPGDTVIDGEVVVLDAEGRPSFNRLQNYCTGGSRIVCFAVQYSHSRPKTYWENRSAKEIDSDGESSTEAGDLIVPVHTFDAPLADLIESIKTP